MNTEFLKAAGIDFEDGFTRCCSNMDLYKRFMVDYASKPEKIMGIKTLYTEKKYKELFERLHDMKGVTGNLGIKIMYRTASKAVELTRNDEYGEELEGYLDELEAQYKVCAEAIHKTFA